MQGNRDGSWSLRASANGGNGNGNGGYHPQSTRAFSNFNFQRPIRYNFQTQHNLNFPHRQIPTFPPHQFGDGANVFLSGDNGGSRTLGSKSKRNVEVMRIDKAVIETRKSLVASGENVSSTRVFQSVLAQLQADSFVVQIQDVPSFRQLMALEGKINAFIHCFVGARRIVTLHDLEVAICRNEFITSEEIVSFLDSYLNAFDTDDVKLDEFLNFVAEKKFVTSKEKLGVRIQSLRMYVSFIQDAKRQEGETLKNLLTELHQKYHILSSKKQRQDESLIVSEHAYSFALHHKDYCGKHTRFYSSSSDDNDDYEVENVNSSDHFNSSCPYPSIVEEMKQLPGSNKKRKAESRNHEKSNSSELLRRVPSKLHRGYAKQVTPKSGDDSDSKQVFSVNEADFTLSEGALRLFISTWKDTCKEISMSVFVENILSFYNLGGSEVQVPIKRAKAMASFPFVGILHVAKELVTEALEEQIPSEITNTNLVAGYDNCAGTSSRASKPNPLRPMPMTSVSTSRNLAHKWKNSVSTVSSVRDQIHTGTPWAAQAQQTCKKGEEIAYRYFATKYGKEAVVRWVNEQSETGLPYDLIIENRGGKKEYVEVKATVSTGKDYFNLTVKEWQFANEKGESYVIAHVLLGNSNAILTQHRNLVKLCQEGYLRVLILMPNQRNGVNVAF
ncbi:unnamed protein product [Arabis nemorensis]|uniref:Protein NO VEIN C-terminal domain-containing protein n=1 Tax=Arabis nemorensis TaxID=586526 RepID=A0A565AM38_9BRAS|nr:unnamed protein product [Arabis nemorensis]VVA90479.1 unnamed protein product [Arabis nemorensis]